MADSAAMSLQPAEVNGLCQQLDVLADRVQRVMGDESAPLTVIAAGRDEVSQRVAHTLNDVHSSFGAAVDRGAGDIRTLASTLRAHSNQVVASEGDQVA